ncbi:MAG: hypothetical protein OXI95_14355 [bacterium]|nr:hypothetical protein [bacterium]MDE0418099.1 hypothetical protein [bacterium]
MTLSTSRCKRPIPFRARDSDKVQAAIDALKHFQKTHSLGGLSVRQIIEEARKY